MKNQPHYLIYRPRKIIIQICVDDLLIYFLLFKIRIIQYIQEHLTPSTSVYISTFLRDQGMNLAKNNCSHGLVPKRRNDFLYT